MESILEELLKKIIIDQYFLDRVWTYPDWSTYNQQSPVSSIVSRLSYDNTILAALKENLLARAYELIDAWKLDDAIAEWLTKALKEKTSSNYYSTTRLDNIAAAIPNLVTQKLLENEDLIRDKIWYDKLRDMISSWDLQISVNIIPIQHKVTWTI